MKSGKNLFALATMFLVLAAAFSVVFWSEVSLAAKIGMFVLGFGSGGAFAGWFGRRTG
jgi:hypothetical protein